MEVFAKYNTEPSFSKYLPEKGKKKERNWSNALRGECSRSTILNALHPLTPVQHSYFFINPENQKRLSTPVIWNSLNQYRSTSWMSWNTVSHDNKWSSMTHFKSTAAKCFTVRIKLTLKKSTYTIHTNMLSNIVIHSFVLCTYTSIERCEHIIRKS